jgi:hypothetical protein
MKRSIANKIEKLLAAMTWTEKSPLETTDTAFRKEDHENLFSARNFGKFCRQIPLRITHFIQPRNPSGA